MDDVYRRVMTHHRLPGPECSRRLNICPPQLMRVGLVFFPFSFCGLAFVQFPKSLPWVCWKINFLELQFILRAMSYLAPSLQQFSQEIFLLLWTEPWRASLCAWSLHKGPNQGHQQRSQARLRVLWCQGHLTMISRHRTFTKQNDEIRWSYVQLTSIDQVVWKHNVGKHC